MNSHGSQHFKPSELACHHCGMYHVEPALLIALEWLRNLVEHPLTVNSGYRCQVHNAAVGSRPSSQHLFGRAADVTCSHVAPAQLAQLAEDVPYFQYGGIGLYNTFVHVDVRDNGPARWTG